MPGLSHTLVPAQESKRWSFGRLLPCHSEGLFLDPKKSRKIRHVNPDLPSIALLGSSTNVKIFHLGLNEGDLPTGQCVLGTIGFDLSTPPCVGVK